VNPKPRRGERHGEVLEHLGVVLLARLLSAPDDKLARHVCLGRNDTAEAPLELRV